LSELDLKKSVIQKQVANIVKKQQQLERQQLQMKALVEAKTKYKAKISQQSLEAKKTINK
jgi:hypothetical protein